MTLTAPTVALDERIFDAAIGTLELFSIHLGRQLGLYSLLGHPRTVEDLARTAGVEERYAREWLEQQAVAGFVTVDDADASWDRRHYSLSLDQEALFALPSDPSHVSPLADMVVGVGQVLDQVTAAFRTGAGVPYAHYGKAFRDGQGAVNRPAYTHDLASTWLGAVPDITDRLRSGGRVADLGCGIGWSTIALARAFPEAEIVGIDSDLASVEDARRNAGDAGIQVRFEHADASTLAASGPYDLVIILEALHDMARPTEVLAEIREALTVGGALLVADEKVAEQFTAPGDELERFMYGWSVVHCLPAALAETPSAALGTVLRPDMVRTIATDAGFNSCEQSEIDAGFFHLYVMR